MKIQNKNILISIIIVNYNNAQFLDQSIRSILSQTYSNFEIIVIDDKSNDNSVEILKKFKKKIIFAINKKKTRYGSYNQMNAYYQGYLKSKGKYLFFLDSDDYFKKNKVEVIMNEFKKKKVKLIFDLPIYKYRNKNINKIFKQKKFIFSNWPRFSPQSCISLERRYATEIFKKVMVKKFESVWFDFRIAIYHFLKNGNIYILKRYLTYYRQLENSASKNYKFFSSNWWFRRNQAHDIVSFFSSKLGVKNKINLDKVITKLIIFLFK